MNIGIMGDIHGNYEALKLVIDDMKKSKIDFVIVLGDIIFWGNEPQKCLDTIVDLKPMVWIKGNTDDWLNEYDETFQPKDEKERKIYREFIRVSNMISKEMIQTIKKLKEKEVIEIAGKKILCVHGSDRDINEPIGIMTSQNDMHDLINRIKCDILLCSHTHAPFLVASSGKLIMNVGSVGLPYDEPKASYGILKFDGDNLEYGIRRVK